MQIFSAKDVYKIAWPLIIEQSFLVLIGVVNTIMSSNISAAAVSAVSYIDALNQLIIAAFMAISTGSTVVISQYTGRDEPENATRAAGQSILAVVSVSATISILMLVFGNALSSRLLGSAEIAVLKNASVYLTCSSVSLVFFGIYTAASGILRGYGNTVKSMRITVVMNIANAVFGALFVYGFHFGVLGVGLALIFARIIGAVLAMFTLLYGEGPHRMQYVPRRFDLAIQKTIMLIGIPVAIETVLFYLGRFLVQIYVVQMGTMYMSVYAIANSITTLFTIPGQALSFTAVTVVGKCIGACYIEEAKSHLKKIIYISSGIWVLILLLIIVVPTYPYIVCLYNPSTKVSQNVFRFITVYLISACLFWAPSFILPNGFKGAGDVRFTTITALVTMFVVRITTGYILGVTFKLYTLGIAIAMCLDWVVRAVIFGIRYFQGGWLKRKVI